jgi:hypothetical protein
MAKPQQPANPFYVLVIVVGVVFLITACGYGTMTYRAIAPGAAGQPPAAHELMTFLDRNGMQLMAWELVALATATFGAMWLDRWRDRQQVPSDPFADQQDRIDAESERFIR